MHVSKCFAKAKNTLYSYGSEIYLRNRKVWTRLAINYSSEMDRKIYKQDLPLETYMLSLKSITKPLKICGVFAEARNIGETQKSRDDCEYLCRISSEFLGVS